MTIPQKSAERQIVVYHCASKFPVIANQSADWCGNPPVRGEMCRKAPAKMGIVTVLGGNRDLIPFNRGIATPVCALARNDSFYSPNTYLLRCSFSKKSSPGFCRGMICLFRKNRQLSMDKISSASSCQSSPSYSKCRVPLGAVPGRRVGSAASCSAGVRAVCI